jgi:hypothetical protein
MGVFANYNNAKSGGVNANAFPNMHTYPAVTTQQNVRSNPNIPSQPQRISPTERGTHFPTSASSGGSLSPIIPTSSPTFSKSGGCGCGGGCGGSIGSNASPTASQLATGNSFHGMKGKSAPGTQTRGQLPRFASMGGLRPTANRPMSRGRVGGRTRSTPTGSMFGGGM